MKMIKLILVGFIILVKCKGKENCNEFNDYPEKCNYIELNEWKGEAQKQSLQIMSQINSDSLYIKYFDNGHFDKNQFEEVIHQFNSQCSFLSGKGGYIDHMYIKGINKPDKIEFYYEYEFDCSKSVNFTLVYRKINEKPILTGFGII